MDEGQIQDKFREFEQQISELQDQVSKLEDQVGAMDRILEFNNLDVIDD